MGAFCGGGGGSREGVLQMGPSLLCTNSQSAEQYHHFQMQIFTRCVFARASSLLGHSHHMTSFFTCSCFTKFAFTAPRYTFVQGVFTQQHSSLQSTSARLKLYVRHSLCMQHCQQSDCSWGTMSCKKDAVNTDGCLQIHPEFFDC